MIKKSAYEWGKAHESCPVALEMRRALGFDKTQADWYLECPRGDWLLWQFYKGLTEGELRSILLLILRVMDKIVEKSAISVKSLAARATFYAMKSRTARATFYAVDGATLAAHMAACVVYANYKDRSVADKAYMAELKTQADDIRMEIPLWIWDV